MTCDRCHIDHSARRAENQKAAADAMRRRLADDYAAKQRKGTIA